MRVGVFTALLAQMPLDGVIAKLKGLGITTVELGTGNYPGDPHCKLSMLEDKAARKEFKQKLDDNGITISALSCHGNPLHPDPARAKHDQDVNKRTIQLAEKLVKNPYTGLLGLVFAESVTMELLVTAIAGFELLQGMAAEHYTPRELKCLDRAREF